MKKYFVVLLFAIGCLADCPLNNYPRQTIIGYIQANIDNDPSLHNSYNQYVYPLSDPLPQKAISVAIGVVGLELNPNQNINFQIDHRPTSSYDQIHFDIFLKDNNYSWKYIKFSFLASQSAKFSINIESNLQQFSTGTEADRYSVYRPLPGFNQFKNQPVIRVYLTGLQAKAKPVNTQEITAMEKQLDSMRLFASNPHLIKLIEQAIQIKKALQFQISDIKILGRILGFSIISNMQIKSLSFSYVLYSNQILKQDHNTMIGDFAIVDGNKHKFTTLNNMGMILAGLTKFTLPRNSYYNFHLAFEDYLGQGYFSVLTSRQYLEVGFTFFSLELKSSKVCQDCPGSNIIFDDKFCVSQCPRGYSRSRRLDNYYCDKCQIQKLKVVSSSGDCVCAKRHYLQISEDLCKPCSYDCYTCETGNRCLTCDNDMFQTQRTMSYSGRCQCPSLRYYDDSAAEDIVCHECHSECRTCNGPRAHDCQTCDSGKQLDSHGFCVCSKGYTQNIDGSCACFPPNILFQGFCTRTDGQCGPNQIAQFVNLGARCICKSDYIQILNDCIKCPSNSIFDQEQLRCICNNNTVMIDGTCTTCGANKVYDQIIGICKCADSTFKTDSGNCINCPIKMAYINGQCECIFNYFQIRSGVCQRCIRSTDGPKCRRNYEIIQG